LEIRKKMRNPDEVRDHIARWYPDERKLEMFARQRVEGRDAWGNEVESDVVI
jgi:N6-adenosine-specific RNA methylase IME4